MIKFLKPGWSVEFYPEFGVDAYGYRVSHTIVLEKSFCHVEQFTKENFKNFDEARDDLAKFAKLKGLSIPEIERVDELP